MLTPLQLHVLSACSKKIKETTNKVALEHKELHTYVSKIGKAIDRVICYFVVFFNSLVGKCVLLKTKTYAK